MKNWMQYEMENEIEAQKQQQQVKNKFECRTWEREKESGIRFWRKKRTLSFLCMCVCVFRYLVFQTTNSCTYCSHLNTRYLYIELGLMKKNTIYWNGHIQKMMWYAWIVIRCKMGLRRRRSSSSSRSSREEENMEPMKKCGGQEINEYEKGNGGKNNNNNNSSSSIMNFTWNGWISDGMDV